MHKNSIISSSNHTTDYFLFENHSLHEKLFLGPPSDGGRPIVTWGPLGTPPPRPRL